MKGDTVFYSRKQFLSLGRKALLMIVISSLYPLERFLTSKDERLPEQHISSDELNFSNNWKRIENTRFWVRQGGNGVEAMWASCTHLGCEVHYDPQQDQWLCPCHGSRYNKEGEPLQGPAITPLARAEVKQKNGYYILKRPAGGA